jgi:hypothetical protein
LANKISNDAVIELTQLIIEPANAFTAQTTEGEILPEFDNYDDEYRLISPNNPPPSVSVVVNDRNSTHRIVVFGIDMTVNKKHSKLSKVLKTISKDMAKIMIAFIIMISNTHLSAIDDDFVYTANVILHIMWRVHIRHSADNAGISADRHTNWVTVDFFITFNTILDILRTTQYGMEVWNRLQIQLADRDLDMTV